MGAGRFAKTGSSPQMRGALKIETGRYRFSGSSPQMRGALPNIAVHTERKRIIPADAGSTRSECCQDCQCRDHPRRCGEH